MATGRQRWWQTGPAIVTGIALGTVLVHALTGGRYGFNRDELLLLDDARNLAWGYPQYPPLTALFARVALEMFGTSLLGFRFFAALAQAAAVVLAGLMAKDLGGGRWSQATTALACVPYSLGAGTLMQYISFDYLCWVAVGYGMVRLTVENTETTQQSIARWWPWVGAWIGLGMMAKYTMGVCALGVAVGIFLTPLRKALRTGWLWAAVATTVGIWLPNFLWQAKRGFVSVEFLRFLHVRDVREGLTNWFLLGQVELTLLAFPLAAAGLYFLSVKAPRYRALGWMYVTALVVLAGLRGRQYYLAPAYPMLYAAGAVWVERNWPMLAGRRIRRGLWVALALDVVIAGMVALPLAPVNSKWFRFIEQVDPVFVEEFGWEELTETVAHIRDHLSPLDRAKLGILTGNYGELGALNLYGKGYGLPKAISGVNGAWERGYGNPAPETLIVVGYTRGFLEEHFATCELAGHTSNRYGVMNEETREDPDIFVCRGLKGDWKEFWRVVRKFA